MRDRVEHSSQDWDSQQQQTDPLFIPQLNILQETFHEWGEEVSNTVVISLQHRLTIHLTKHWEPVSGATFSHHAELCLHRTQCIVFNVIDSVLRTEMGDLDPREENASSCRLILQVLWVLLTSSWASV